MKLCKQHDRKTFRFNTVQKGAMAFLVTVGAALAFMLLLSRLPHA
jgi:hypothetical protein